MSRGAILMFGPPQSGKGTYGRRLSRAMGIPFFSAGEAIRDRLREDEDWFEGRYSQEMHDQGEFCPPELVRDLVFDLIEGSEYGCVLDGYPRNENQFEDLRDSGLDYLVVWLNVPDEELVRRATGRRICSNCEEVYNLNNEHMQPGAEGRCSIEGCGGALVRRGDDEEDVVLSRIEKYRRETLPVLESCAIDNATIIEFSPTGDDVDSQCEILMEIVEEVWGVDV